MTVETMTQKLRLQRFGAGFVLGIISGFYLRDEFYYPTYKKIDDIVEAYKIKAMEIRLRKKELADELSL